MVKKLIEKIIKGYCFFRKKTRKTSNTIVIEWKTRIKLHRKSIVWRVI